VRSGLVVMAQVPAKHTFELPGTEDEELVQAVLSGRPHLTLGKRVRDWRLHRPSLPSAPARRLRNAHSPRAPTAADHCRIDVAQQSASQLLGASVNSSARHLPPLE
jgi:hypothetical protein